MLCGAYSLVVTAELVYRIIACVCIVCGTVCVREARLVAENTNLTERSRLVSWQQVMRCARRKKSKPAAGGTEAPTETLMPHFRRRPAGGVGGTRAG